MTHIPRKLYWKVWAGTCIVSVLMFMFTLAFAWYRAKEERNKLCLVLYAAIDRGEFGSRPKLEGRLLMELPCRSEAEGRNK